jgi:5-methylcytosine-specific restriction endonuclease McrA
MRICSGPGCLRAVQDNVTFCDECKPARASTDEIRNHTSGYDAELDRLRKGPRWQRIRKAVVLRDPLCQRCQLRITDEIDHIVPAREAIEQARASGRYLFDKYAGYYLKSNLQGLCRIDHHAKTLEDKAHTGAWPDVIAREQAAPKRRYTF